MDKITDDEIPSKHVDLWRKDFSSNDTFSKLLINLGVADNLVEAEAYVYVAITYTSVYTTSLGDTNDSETNNPTNPGPA